MNLANKITLSRIGLTIIAVLALYIDFPYHTLTTLILFIVAMSTDAIDGHVARKYNMVTKLGAILDPLMDKLTIGGFLICLLDLKVFPILMVLIILGREILVSTFRNIGKAHDVTIKALPSGKLKTVFQTIAIGFGLLEATAERQEIMALTPYIGIIDKIALTFLAIALILSIYSMFELYFKHKYSVINNFKQ